MKPLLLVVGLHTRIAAGAAALLLIAFVAAVASVAARGLSIDCGCFGGGGTVASGQTKYLSEIVRDVGLLVLAGWLIRHPLSLLSCDRPMWRTDDQPDS